jgi:alpha-mannosidase
MTGHKFIVEELKVPTPTITWQIDSFGVSKGFARLATDMGFEAMFYSRVDTDDKVKITKNKEKVSVWRPSE